MKKKILSLILFLKLICYSANSLAAVDPADNDSCVNGVTIIQRIINNIVSLGLFTTYSLSFDMKSAEDSYCRIPTNDVKFKYTYYSITKDEVVTDNYTFNEGSWDYWALGPATARGVYKYDQVCVDFLTLVGYQTIGCKYRPDPEVRTCDGSTCQGNENSIVSCTRGSRGECIDRRITPKKDCLVADSCSYQNGPDSISILPISGPIVRCVRESIQRIFSNTDLCKLEGKKQVNLFPSFQASMRDIVKTLLTIYVIFFGMRISLLGEMQKKSEIMMFVGKLIFVMYFSIGIGGDKTGIEHFRKATEVATFSLSKIMLNAGGASGKGLCNYPYSLFPEDQKYLALFYAFDCRIQHYLGIEFDITPGGAYRGIRAIQIFNMFLPALFGMQIIFFAMLIVFLVFFISIIVFFVQFYIIAIVLQAILIYLAPIFVPFALFKFTKGYFDSWLRLIVAYTLQPMIVTTFIGLMLTLYDGIIYENCTFQQSTVTISGDSKTYSIPQWKIALPSTNQQRCKDSWGWNFGYEAKASLYNEIEAVFFSFNVLNPTVVAKLFLSTLTLILFSAIFYGFSTMLSGFAADLVGGIGLGSIAGSPTALASAVGSAAGKVADYIANPGDKDSGGKGDSGASVAGGSGSGASVARGNSANAGGGGSGAAVG